MKHIVDTFLIKIVFLFVIVSFLYLYKKIHLLLIPKDLRSLHENFTPEKNYADTLLICSRLISIGIVLSPLTINFYSDLFLNLLHFISWSIISTCTYAASLYVIEGIILYPFEYAEEIHNKKNIAYTIISSTLSLACAFLIRSAVIATSFNFLLVAITYLLLLVIFITLLKMYPFISVFNLKESLKTRDLSAALSFSGYIIGIIILCITAQENPLGNYQHQLLQITTQIILAVLLFPIFKFGINKVFKIKRSDAFLTEEKRLGYGISEGAIFCLSSLFTSILIPSIKVTSAFPIFNSLPSF